MGPSHLEPDRSQGPSQRPAWSHGQFSGRVQTQQSSRNLRSEGENACALAVNVAMYLPVVDSWIEIPAATSAASPASYAPNDEIITTGLQVRRDGATQSRQLRLSGLPGRSAALQRASSQASGNGSSQDEYDESESDSDRVLSSSNEDVANISGADEEDDTHTALGVGRSNRNIFTPQPHAFSQPATVRAGSISHQDSYFPPTQPPPSSSFRIPSNRVPTIQRPPVTERRSTSNIQPDHDAALRASLTALLEFAPATRKETQSQPLINRTAQPATLRLVSEAQLNAEADTQLRAVKPPQKRRSRESSKERQAKKPRPVKSVPSEELTISPTMMTWFISAGFVLVLSAISFSAGYAWGKEVGRVEGQLGLDGASCGREAMRGSRTGLSKLRLSSVRA